jgi:hypothetical protein
VPSGASHHLCTVTTVAQDLEQLIDEITVDAYGLDEQLTGFLQVFLDEVSLPASAVVLGSAVEVVGFAFEGDERRGLVAQCRHGKVTGTVSLIDVCFELGSIAGWLHAAYRTWLGVPPFSARQPLHWTWPST